MTRAVSARLAAAALLVLLSACATTPAGTPEEEADRRLCRQDADAARLRAEALDSSSQQRTVVGRDGRAISVPMAPGTGGFATQRDTYEQCMKQRAAERGAKI